MNQDKPSKEQLCEPLISAVAAAKLLGVNRQWVYAHTARCEPRLPHYRLGGSLLFRASEINEFIARCKVSSESLNNGKK